MKIRIKGIKNAIFLAIILPIVVILPLRGVNADVVEHLYEAEMPVEGQSREERTYVVREALKEVLVRISGRNEAGALAMDTALVPRPTRFVQQFRYRNFSQDEAIPVSLDGAKPYTQKLWLLFTKKTVAKLLREQGFPVWGKTRPATLVWLAVDDQKQRLLLGNSTEHPGRTYIEKEAKKRGLPLRLPLLDLADQLKLQVTDVWGNFADTLLDASLRYQAESVLVGRVYLSFSNTWHTRWTLYSDGQRQDWEISNRENLREAINAGLSVTGEALSLKFTQVNDVESSDVVVIKINNVASLSAYNKVTKYLKSLNVVSELQTPQINQDSIYIKIKSNRGKEGVAQAIALGHMLVADVAPPVEQGESKENDSSDKKPNPLVADLVYQLVQ